MNKEQGIPAQVVYPQYAVQEDEIDLNELFNKLWQRRKFVIAFVFIVAVLTLGLLSALFLLDPPEKRYSVIVQFNFPGAENGIYPAGQPFSYNDLVTSKVLTEVYQTNQLEAESIEFDDFINALTVNPYARNIEFIKRKYQGMLSSKNLSRAEIEALDQAYLEELNAAQARFARLSFIESRLIGLDNYMAQKLLTDIPRVWSRQAIDELGVLDLKIAGAGFYQARLVERFEYLQTMDYLKESAEYLLQAVNNLVEDEIGGLVRNQSSGITGYDLQVQLRRLIDYEIEPLFDSVTSMGITRDVDKALIYMDNTIQNLQDKKQVLANKAANIERIVAQYAESKKFSQSSEQPGMGGLAQLDGTFLDRITGLIEDKNDQAYKQELLNQRLKILQDIENIEGDIIKFKRAQERLLDSEKNVSKDIRASVIADIELTRQNFETFISEYKQLLIARNQQVLGSSVNLYQLASSDVLVDSSLLDRLREIVIFSLIAAFLAGVLAMLVALVKSAPQAAVSSE